MPFVFVCDDDKESTISDQPRNGLDCCFSNPTNALHISIPSSLTHSLPLSSFPPPFVHLSLTIRLAFLSPCQQQQQHPRSPPSMSIGHHHGIPISHSDAPNVRTVVLHRLTPTDSGPIGRSMVEGPCEAFTAAAAATTGELRPPDTTEPVRNNHPSATVQRRNPPLGALNASLQLYIRSRSNRPYPVIRIYRSMKFLWNASLCRVQRSTKVDGLSACHRYGYL